MAPQRPDLTSMKALLVTASAAYPLVITHREKVSPDTCEVGRNGRVLCGSRYGLDEISTEGRFDRTPRSFRLSDLTLVQFDGTYEKTLASVAESRARGQS